MILNIRILSFNVQNHKCMLETLKYESQKTKIVL